MFPAMLPPPTPFKLFALAAAVSEMKLSQFLLAIFAGRFVRFLMLSILTLMFGPDFVRISGSCFPRTLAMGAGSGRCRIGDLAGGDQAKTKEEEKCRQRAPRSCSGQVESCTRTAWSVAGLSRWPRGRYC